MPTLGATTNFPQGFAAGLTLRGLPILQTQPGNVFWLYNGTTLERGEVGGSDTNRGTFQRPFSTLAGALLQCTAGKGDIILVKPGHAETISTSTALDMNVADVAVIGLGGGTNRPSFTLDTANTATINVSANNVSFQNIQFVANFLNIAALFTLTTAKFFAVDSCEVRDNSTILNFLGIAVTSTTDNASDGLSLTNNNIVGLATTGAYYLYKPLGSQDRVVIADNFYSVVTTGTGAVVPQASGKILTNWRLLRNHFNLVNAAGTATGYIFTTNSSTNTGFIDGNMDHALPTTPLFGTATSGYVYGLNYHSNTADLQGYLVPGADS